MFDISLETAGEIVLRSLIVYVTVVALLRVGGRRELGQITTTDIVVMILIANAVQNAMVGPDASLPGGLLSALTLVSANFVVGRLRLRYPGFQHLIDGRTVTIASDGNWVEHALHAVALSPEDALGQMGADVNDVRELAWATVDPGGRIRYKTRSGIVRLTATRVPMD
jgi:uncharacterized membrane protein YcaP (DUF421 family)